MNEQATLEPPEVRHLRAGDETVGSTEPNNPISPQAPSEGRGVPSPAHQPALPRRGGRWFMAFCGLLALLAAAIALAAPGLRPIVAASADRWFGGDNLVSRLVAPEGSLDVRAMAMQVMHEQLADFSARLDRLAAVQQSTSSELGRALVNIRADHAASETLTRSVDDLARQTDDLRAATIAMDRRVRAAGVLTLAMRLRRDLDAGAPIGGNLTALAAAGPYPPDVEMALRQLDNFRDGASTMRDLADELDGIIARLSAASGTEGSWVGRNWTRVTALFGGAPSANALLVRRLRALAADGRFTEAASELMASDAADEGLAWAARVRARATAVIATQSLLTYSLAAYENAFVATSVQ